MGSAADDKTSARGRRHAGRSDSLTLARVVYTSRATTPLLEPALLTLARSAASRNHTEHVTGVVIYDDAHFYQWLEGPVAAVDRILHSISLDTRQADMRVVDRHSIDRRSFGAWDMQLVTLGAADHSVTPGGVTRPPAGLIEALRSRPNDATELLARLSCVATTSTSDLLRDLFVGQILPELALRHQITSPALLPVRRRLTKLKHLSVRGAP